MKFKESVQFLIVLSFLFMVGCTNFPREDVSRGDSDIAESFYDTAVVQGDSLKLVTDTGEVSLKTVYYSGKHYSFLGIDEDADTAIFSEIKDPILKRSIPSTVLKNLKSRFTVVTDVDDSATIANADLICRSVSFEEEYTYYSYYNYWYGGYYYYYYPGYWYSTTYTVGSMIIDISFDTGDIDSESGNNVFRPIWLGVATGLTSNDSNTDIQPRADALINQMFDQSTYLKKNN
jgi:hypothetical protein